MSKEKNSQRIKRRKRIRAKIKGTKNCPRLNVFRSNRGMYVQLIDDDKGMTIAAASSREINVQAVKKDVSFQLGKLIAKKALGKKTEKVVFDRGGYKYHGRVRALADGAREGGLKF